MYGERIVIYIPRGGSNFYLSENFMTWEFRCPCCRTVKLDEDLLGTLEELRTLAGETPLYVSSGYRCPAHNRSVGGSKNSYHMWGWAADIYSRVITPKELAAYADKIPRFKGIGLYRKHVHVDIRGKLVRWISNSVQ